MKISRLLACTVCICLAAMWCSAKTDNTASDNKLAHLPRQLLFTENVGQLADNSGKKRPEVLFTAHNGTTNIYLTATAIHYQFVKTIYPAGYDDMSSGNAKNMAEQEKEIKTESYSFSLQLAGANAHPVIRREKKSAFTQNFYLPQCPDGLTGISSYERIVYENVYPQIDWVVYSNEDHLKYDFIVKPGGDVSKIKLAVKDAQHVIITEKGELLMTTSLGEVREHAPVSFADGKEVATSFKQNADGSIGFSVATVPSGATLTIDPSVSWATYYGGSVTETPYSVLTDASGNVFIVGTTTSVGGIFYTGGFQSVFGGGTGDGYVAKFNAAGTIQWATYYGGTGGDQFTAGAVDGSGNVYATGSAVSTGLATTGAFQVAPVASADIIIAKFNSTGGRVWATYFGGNASDIAYSCAVDASNNLFIAGYTQSTGMATTGAYQGSLAAAASQDALLAKFDPTGNRLWSTYLGGTSTEQARSCAVDASGNVYMTGYTNSPTGMSSTGSYQPANNGGTYDAFLAKFSGAGSMVWSTYYGGTGLDQGGACATDPTGNVYLTGPTGSTDYLASTGAYHTANAGSNDIYIAKFDAAGARLWSTFYGGPTIENALAAIVDGSDNIIVAGTTNSVSGISSGGFQAAAGGSNDAMIIKFDATGSFLWASYFGGTGADGGTGVAVSPGKIYVTGGAGSTGLATTGAYQAAPAGSTDAYLLQITDNAPAITTGTIAGSPLCAGTAVAVTYTATGTYTAGNIYTAQLSDAAGSFTTPVTIGTLTATTTGTVTATIPAGTTTGTGYRIRVISSTPAVTGSDNGVNVTVNALPAISAGSSVTICNGASTPLTATGGVTYTWEPASSLSASTGTTVTASPTSNTTYTVTGTASTGCSDTASVTVSVTALPTIIPSAGVAFCYGSSATISATGGTTYTWAPAASLSASTGATVDAYPTATTTYTITGTTAGCSNTATLTLTVNALPIINAGTGIAICAGSSTPLTATGGVSYSWSPAGSLSAGTGTTVTASPATSTTYTVTGNDGTCSNTATVTVTVNALPTISAGSNVAICAGTSTPLTATGGTTYTWSPTTALSATTGATVTASPTANTTYTVTGNDGSCSNTATVTVTVNALPTVDAGPGIAMCSGSPTAITATGATTYTWSPYTGLSATTGASTTANPVSNITYTVTGSTGSCSNTATVAVTVNPLPTVAGITGTASVCAMATTTLSNATTGGAWSSDASTVANVSTSGIVTGLSAGTATISYTVTTGCGFATATMVVTVSPLSDPGTITGIGQVCIGSSDPLTNLVTGGTWTSANTAIATVNTTGAVTGIAAGTTNISYTVNTGCGIATATKEITVNPLPAAIAGPSSVCMGSTITLTDATPLGIWSSASGNVSVGTLTGIITGVTNGTAMITYTLPTSCKVTKVVMVNQLPAPITGVANVCIGLTTALSDVTPSGTWSVSNANATISGSGIVTGVTAGTVNVTYTATTGCIATRMIVVNPLPGAISGTAVVCAGSSTLLTAAGGGTWTSGSANATAGLTTGIINGTAVGTAMITYTLSTGCIGTQIVTINPTPQAYTVTGGGAYCAGSTGQHIGLSNSATGISYQLYYGAAISGSALAGTTGMAIDFGVFTTTGTYSVLATNTTTGCTRNMSGTAVISVNPILIPFVMLTSTAPNDTSCTGVAVSFTATATNGGTAPAYQWWVNGVTSGTGAVYSYIPGNGDIIRVKLTSNAACAMPDSAIALRTITVLPYLIPSLTISASANPACEGSVVTFTATGVNGGSEPFYRWTQNGINVATGPHYLIVPADGDTLYALMRTNYACSLADSVYSTNGIVMSTITSVAPVFTITATPGFNISTGQTITLNAVVAGGGVYTYLWLRNGVAISGATAASYSSNTLENNDVISCQVANSDACAYATTHTQVIHVSTGLNGVTNADESISIVPNPNKGIFTVSGSIGEGKGADVSINIVNMLGQVVYSHKFASINGTINEQIQLTNTLADGTYLLDVRSGSDNKTLHFIMRK